MIAQRASVPALTEIDRPVKSKEKILAEQIWDAIDALLRKEYQAHINDLNVNINVPTQSITLKGNCQHARYKALAESATNEAIRSTKVKGYDIINEIEVL